MTTTPYRSFIETQFPVALLSKESYKERKAAAAGHGRPVEGIPVLSRVSGQPLG